MELQYDVRAAIHEVIFSRVTDLDSLRTCPKAELLYMLFEKEFRPVDQLPHGVDSYSPGMDKIVLIPMMHRSRLYFESLHRAEVLTASGIRAICHNGSHHYYVCLEDSSLVEKINAIEDVNAHNDTWWKNLARGSGLDLLAIMDDPVDDPLALALPVPEPEPVVLALPPPVPPLALPPPLYLQPMEFKFPCGDKTLSIHLDGFSHQSGIRRAYAKCPWPHGNCFKYCHFTGFDQPWKCVAYVLAYMRAGVMHDDKYGHQGCGVHNGNDLEGEMPAVLFDPAIAGPG